MTTTKVTQVTTHLFEDVTSAEKAYQDVLSEGYAQKDIYVIMSEDSRSKYSGAVQVNEESRITEGVGIGTATGVAIGGVFAAIAAIGTILAFPGTNILIAGPIAAGLAGAGMGGITGGFVGALIGWGIPEDTAKIYETGIQSGGVVLGIPKKRPDGSFEKAGKITDKLY